MTDIVERLHNAPETIWLQVDPDGIYPTDEFLPYVATWCQDKINDSDVEYVRVDVVESLRQQLAECQAREKVLRDALKESYDEDGLCVDPDEFVKPSDSTALDQAIRQALKNEELNGWKRVVIDGLVVAHILTKEHEADPRKALNDLICWSNDVALDPAVSSDATNLKKQWQRETLLDAAEQMESYCGPTVYYELHRMAKELEETK